jgi:hypothetical protein
MNSKDVSGKRVDIMRYFDFIGPYKSEENTSKHAVKSGTAITAMCLHLLLLASASIMSK